MIYEIRDKQVMLDSDLAKLYECTNGTKDINKAVKRNIERFPEEFYFELTSEECSRFQIGTLNTKRGGNIKYLPHVFTEQGIAMLSSVLHTEKAIKTSIQIIKAFVAMRHYINNNEYRLSNVETKLLEHDSEIKELKEVFDKFKEEDEIYFDGKEYDAYSKIIDIFNSCKEEMIIVDRFVDKTILDMIKNLKIKVIIITSNKSKLSKLDIDKYNSTYNNLAIYYDDTFHDRYIIIDKDKIYHSGNSINYIGYRKSNINILSDKNVINTILNDIKNLIK